MENAIAQVSSEISVDSNTMALAGKLVLASNYLEEADKIIGTLRKKARAEEKSTY